MQEVWLTENKEPQLHIVTHFGQVIPGHNKSGVIESHIL
jgi:hypothetical protein